MNKWDRILDIALQIIRLQSHAEAKKAEHTALRAMQALLLGVLTAGLAIAGLCVLFVAMYLSLALVIPAPAAMAIIGLILLILALTTHLLAARRDRQPVDR